MIKFGVFQDASFLFLIFFFSYQSSILIVVFIYCCLTPVATFYLKRTTLNIPSFSPDSINVCSLQCIRSNIAVGRADETWSENSIICFHQDIFPLIIVSQHKVLTTKIMHHASQNMIKASFSQIAKKANNSPLAKLLGDLNKSSPNRFILILIC